MLHQETWSAYVRASTALTFAHVLRNECVP